MSKRWHGFVTAAVLLVLTACGGSGGQSSSNGQPKAGGSVTFGLRADFLSLDPTRLTNDSDQSVANGIYDPLIARVADKGALSPWLADSWDASADLRSLTLHLHQGVKFHDGTPFNADAVVFNISRHLNNPAEGQIADALLIDSASKVDDNTVVIKLKTPWIDFPQILVGPIGLMASPAAVQKYGADYGRHPVGTGPFVFQEWLTGDHVTAVKNQSYWRPNQPYLDKVTWRPIPDQDSRYASLKAGQIDVLQVPTSNQVILAQKDSKLTVQRLLGTGHTYVALNTRAEPFNDPNARLALSYATDRKSYIDQITRGLQRLATGPVPKDSEWYKDPSEPSFDLARAKAALAAYGKPLKFKFNLVSDPLNLQIGQVLQAQWKTAGIEVELAQMDQATLIQAARDHSFQATIGQSADWYDPDRDFFPLFYSRSGVQNISQYSNPAVDQALLAGRTSTDQSVRKQAYATFESEIAKDQPFVWLNYNTIYTITNSRVHGLNTLYSGLSKPWGVWVS